MHLLVEFLIANELCHRLQKLCHRTACELKVDRENGLWAIDSSNPNGSAGMLKHLGISSADVTLFQKSRVIEEDAMTSAQKAARTSGWRSAVAPALVTDLDGISAGTPYCSSIFLRHEKQVSGIHSQQV